MQAASLQQFLVDSQHNCKYLHLQQGSFFNIICSEYIIYPHTWHIRYTLSPAISFLFFVKMHINIEYKIIDNIIEEQYRNIIH